MAVVQTKNHMCKRPALIRTQKWTYESQMFLSHINTSLSTDPRMKEKKNSGEVGREGGDQRSFKRHHTDLSTASKKTLDMVFSPMLDNLESCLLLLLPYHGQALTMHHVTAMWAHYRHSAESLTWLKSVSAGTACQQWQVETITVLWLLTVAHTESLLKETVLSQQTGNWPKWY